MNGMTRKQPKVTPDERLHWAHDRMMDALRRAAAQRDDRSLTTAAFARMAEYDDLLTRRLSINEQARRDKISNARRAAGKQRSRLHWLTH